MYLLTYLFGLFSECFKIIYCLFNHNFADNDYLHLLINLRSPRDYVGLPFFREAHCAQATVARLVTFVSLKWKYSFALLKWKYSFALFMKLGSLLYLRCRHRSAKSTAVSNKAFLFQVTNIYLFCGSVTPST